MRILPAALFVFLMLASHRAGSAELSPYVQQRAASVDKVIRILGPLAKMAREQRSNLSGRSQAERDPAVAEADLDDR